MDLQKHFDSNIIRIVIGIILSDVSVTSCNGGQMSFVDFSPNLNVLKDSHRSRANVAEILRQKPDSEEEIQSILEEQYKFRNDEFSTRYKIAKDEPVKAGKNDSKPTVKVNKKTKAGWQLKSWETIHLANIFRRNKDWSQSGEKNEIAWAFRTYAVRRIVGGMETSISMYPYNVAIARNAKHWCGGSIIDEQWVLTAGHCLESAFDGDKRKLNPFIIRGGSSFHNRGGYQARINKVFFPDKYAPGNADYDFSLLRLDRPMPIGRNIAVLNLPSKDYIIKAHDILIVTGWGSTHETGFGHIPNRVRFVPVPAMKLEECQNFYRFYITPRMLCAGYATGGKDACNHDSGGPAVRDGVLIGIVSFGGKQCGDPRSPGVYSRVSQMTEWVEKTIVDNEAGNVPELQEKIKKAREREHELQRFKARVEDKKNRIKSWLRETLKSPSFIELAKKKLKQAGMQVQRRFMEPEEQNATLEESAIDESNLANLISERILQTDDKNEDEQMFRALALKEVISDDERTDRGNFDDLVAYITEDQ